MDTIYALASARGKAGVAVVRISGPDAFISVGRLCTLPPDHVAAVRTLEWRGDILDRALVITFGDRRSFTGETVVELHLHGSSAIIGATLHALDELGLRLARPGEFTRRAMENGNLDLAQVEGLADLIDAETEAQRRQAMRVLSGAIGALADSIKRHLVNAAAVMAAAIDFSDEDLPADLLDEISTDLVAARKTLVEALGGAGASERIRDGFEVAIIGAPNTGKSSLLNALVGRDVAITSPTAGTTRDVIEARMEISGFAVTLLDTAGLRDATDAIEAVGVARARQRAESADLRIILQQTDGNTDVPTKPGDIFVHSKADLCAAPVGAVAVSACSGSGIPELVAAIARELQSRTAHASSITRARHRLSMNRAIRSLDLALVELENGDDRIEIVSEHVNGAIRAMDSLVGKVDVEDVLDQVFSSFCIGK